MMVSVGAPDVYVSKHEAYPRGTARVHEMKEQA